MIFFGGFVTSLAQVILRKSFPDDIIAANQSSCLKDQLHHHQLQPYLCFQPELITHQRSANSLSFET